MQLIKKLNNVNFAHYEILVYIKRDYYLSILQIPFGISPLHLSLPSLCLLSSFFSFFFPVFLLSFLCLPPTVEWMLKLSLRGTCIVPACAFFNFIWYGAWGFGSPFQCKGPMPVPLELTSEQLCIPRVPMVLLHERLLTCLRAAGSPYHIAYYGSTKHVLFWSCQVWHFALPLTVSLSSFSHFPFYSNFIPISSLTSLLWMQILDVFVFTVFQCINFFVAISTHIWQLWSTVWRWD